jgi:hypothetical protein
MLRSVQVFGTQTVPTQVFDALQNWPAGHGPHRSTLPQPSLMDPHTADWSVQLFGEQLAKPQTFALPPPPQVWPTGQSPQ